MVRHPRLGHGGWGWVGQRPVLVQGGGKLVCVAPSLTCAVWVPKDTALVA